MRLLLAVLPLLFPVSSHAFLMHYFDYEGEIFGYGTGEPDPENKIGKTFKGSFSVNDNAEMVSSARQLESETARYNANGTFIYEFEGRRMIKSGILDITLERVYANGQSNVYMQFFDATWEDTQEMAYGKFWWGYEPGTFNGVSFENIKQSAPFVIGYGHTKKYLPGRTEPHYVWDTHSEIRQVVSADFEMDAAPTPEPGTIFLSMLGLGALGFLKRKRG